MGGRGGRVEGEVGRVEGGGGMMGGKDGVGGGIAEEKDEGGEGRV